MTTIRSTGPVEASEELDLDMVCRFRVSGITNIIVVQGARLIGWSRLMLGALQVSWCITRRMGESNEKEQFIHGFLRIIKRSTRVAFKHLYG